MRHLQLEINNKNQQQNSEETSEKNKLIGLDKNSFFHMTEELKNSIKNIEHEEQHLQKIMLKNLNNQQSQLMQIVPWIAKNNNSYDLFKKEKSDNEKKMSSSNDCYQEQTVNKILASAITKSCDNSYTNKNLLNQSEPNATHVFYKVEEPVEKKNLLKRQYNLFESYEYCSFIIFFLIELLE